MNQVAPGERLGSLEEYQSGEGTYQRSTGVFASRLGIQQIVPATQQGEVLGSVVGEKVCNDGNSFLPVVWLEIKKPQQYPRWIPW